MKVVLTMTLEITSVQKASALRDQFVALIDADPTVTLLSQGVAKLTRPYKVLGVDLATSQVFSQQVDAADADAAKTQVASATLVVVTVLPLTNH